MNRRAELLAWLGNRMGKPPGWERVARWLAPPARFAADEELCLVRDGYLFVTRPSLPIGWHVTLFGSYEPELRAIFRAVLPPGGVALDVGANTGWHTLLMARLAGEAGRVLAVEPNPHVRIKLEENLAINRTTQVEVLACALAEGAGTVQFMAPAADDAGSGDGHVAGAGELARGDLVAVPTRALDDVAGELARLDLVKIDVEGYEWPVLRGAEATVARLRPHIVFEYDRDYAARGGGTPELIAGYFARHRYRLHAVGRDVSRAIDAAHWPVSANVWAVPAR